MSGELDRTPDLTPVEHQAPVPADKTQHPSDAITTGNDALLFSDNDLMGGIKFLNQNLQVTGVDLPGIDFTDSNADDDDAEHLISFAPDGDAGQPLPERPPVTPQQISAMITNLDSPAFRTRDQAQRDVEAAGAAALPQLFEAITNAPSLEVQRRAESAVRRITDNMSTDQLLALRDPAQRQRAITAGVTAPLNAEQTQRVDAAMEGAARSGIEGRLTNPTWLNDLEIAWKGKLGIFNRPPTEASVTQFDRMATPEGRQQVTQRLNELTRIMASENITSAERETIARQIAEIARVSSPEHIANGRLAARTSLAQHLSENGGNPDRINTLMLEAHRLSDRPAQPQNQQGFGRIQHDPREGVRHQIVQLGLDQNPAFMQRFGTQAGQAEVQAIQDIRTQVEEQRRLDALPENQNRGIKRNN
jgi:hypothetical protein